MRDTRRAWDVGVEECQDRIPPLGTVSMCRLADRAGGNDITAPLALVYFVFRSHIRVYKCYVCDDPDSALAVYRTSALPFRLFHIVTFRHLWKSVSVSNQVD